jgi:hypothetical protein
MEPVPTVEVSPALLLQRIDAVMWELQKLRQLVSAQPLSPVGLQEPDLVAQLTGCLGQGSWDEYEDDIEWERFGYERTAG